MARLAAALRSYVCRRLATHPAWAGLAVVLSDAAVPGEGEHKIMEHIRTQRALPGYDANLCVGFGSLGRTRARARPPARPRRPSRRRGAARARRLARTGGIPSDLTQ
jgi:hypothetical protein